MVGDGKYLRISEVIARLREAGFPESESTVRRMIDLGELEAYRGGRPGSHRRVTAESVEAWIAKNKGGSSAPAE